MGSDTPSSLPDKPPPQGQQVLPSGEFTVAYEEWRHTGFLVPPYLLREYEALVPGSAKQVLDTFTSQTQHRQSLEAAAIGGDLKRAATAQWLGALIALGALSVAGLAIHNGANLTGLAIVLGEIASLAGIYVYGQKKSAHQLAQKAAVVPDPATEQPPPHAIAQGGQSRNQSKDRPKRNKRRR